MARSDKAEVMKADETRQKNSESMSGALRYQQSKDKNEGRLKMQQEQAIVMSSPR